MSFSNYAEKAILDHVYGPTPMTAPSARYVSLHSSDPGETGANELASTHGYTRRAATFDAATSGAGTTQNSGAVTFTNTGTVAVTDDWVQATYFCVWDALSGGNCLGIGPLAVAKTVEAGDSATFAIGALVVSLA